MKRAQAHLLEQLYAYLSTMSGGETEALLEEDPEISQRRARCKQARPPWAPTARDRRRPTLPMHLRGLFASAHGLGG